MSVHSLVETEDSPAKRARIDLKPRVCTGNCDREKFMHGVLTVVEQPYIDSARVMLRSVLVCAPIPPEPLLSAISDCHEDDTDIFGDFENEEANEEDSGLLWDARPDDEDYVIITRSVARTAWLMAAGKRVARFPFSGMAAIEPEEVLKRFFADRDCDYLPFVKDMAAAKVNANNDLTNVRFNVRLLHNPERY